MPKTKANNTRTRNARSIFWRYRKGLMSQAPNVSRKRIGNMRKAMNRELKRAGVPAFQRRQADENFVNTAKQALS